MKASACYTAEPIKLETFDDNLREVNGIITAWIKKRFKDRDRVVVTLNDNEWSLILNDTCYRVLKRAYGDETEDWIGKSIIVFIGKVRYSGVEQDGICIRVAEGDDALGKAVGF